jgi:hypothetical protein
MTVIDIFTREEHIPRKPADLEAIAEEMWQDEINDALQELILVQSCLESLLKRDWEILLEAGKQFDYFTINKTVRNIVMKSEKGNTNG